jgi:hypothetical protein
MATGKISIYDRVVQRTAPLIASAEPQLDSNNSPCTRIKLEQRHIGLSDRPEATIGAYWAVICLSGFSETEYAPGFRQRGFRVVYQPGTLFLTGHGDMLSATSREIDLLALEIAPNFVSWAWSSA